MSGDFASKVRAEQVATTFGTMPGAILTGSLLAVLVSAIYYVDSPRPAILAWLAIHLAVKLRHRRILAYFDDPHAAERSAHWSAVLTRELIFTSSTWALAPWLLLPEGNVPLAALLALVMLTLASAGMLAVAPMRGAIFAHAVPMTCGLGLALAWGATGLEWVLASCCVLYLGVTIRFALRQHALITRALEERFAKEALATQLEQQVEVVQRANEQKTRFFASASHDLRQPVHAIALFGTVLQKELGGLPQQAHADRLMRAVESLGMSLETMLDASRLDAGVVTAETRGITVNSLFQSLHSLFDARATEKGLSLRLRASPLCLRSDPDLLQRLLANVIENAVKYTPRGGVLVVARLRGAEAWIECYDSGIGIPAEHLPRVFEEFYQVGNPSRDRMRGLGMGLAIVQRLADLLGHRVEIQSEPGRGTRVRVIVPVALAPSPVIVDQPQPARPTEHATLPRRVLVLDDEADVADAIAALLTSHGSEVTVTRDEAAAQTALDRATSAGEPFDAFVCDFRLAEGAEGLDAALRLRERTTPRLPVLLVTGETSTERLQRVHRSGIPVLFKPASGPALLEALSRLAANPEPAS